MASELRAIWTWFSVLLHEGAEPVAAEVVELGEGWSLDALQEIHSRSLVEESDRARGAIDSTHLCARSLVHPACNC
jgi:hypothetical protein